MNLTELARQLKVSANDLRDALPTLGFDVGKKAIKIDNNVAFQIMRSWPRYVRNKEEERKRRLEEEKKEQRAVNQAMNVEINIPHYITVRDFAHKLGQPLNKVIADLMKNGVMASLNEKIDYETAAILGEDFGVKVNLEKEEDIEENVNNEEILKGILQKETKLNFRPPVVVVMGHVDHGKTKLLDAIRKTDIVSQESGGITQHIGAYQVKKQGKKITFIDTPGHEAFTAMRSRGAKVADIAVLVVAADDSIKPQTLEAIKIIQKAKLPMIVAINKVDKPDANVLKVKQDLAQINLAPEDFGGKTICVEVSAKQEININGLLEIILLVYDMEKENIKANPKGQCVVSIVEAHVDKGVGPVATLLVQNGTLRLGDNLVIGDVWYGKVRAMKDWLGEDVSEAEPAKPVKVIGFRQAPQVGDIVEVKEDIKDYKKAARKVIKQIQPAGIKSFSETENDKSKSKQFLNLILKTDVFGSAEAIMESLEKIENPEVGVKVISHGLGNVTQNDILRASTENAFVIGFNVAVPPDSLDLAKDKGVDARRYTIIYELLDFVRSKLKEMFKEEIVLELLGKVKVLAIFRQEHKNIIFGGRVMEGKAQPNTIVKVWRKEKFIGQGNLKELQAGRQVVTDVLVGSECGINLIGVPDLEIDDIVEIYQEKEVKKEL